MSLVRFACFVIALIAPVAAMAQAEAIKGVPIFETPRFAEEENLIFQLIRSGALDRAAKSVDGLIQRYPNAPRLRVMKAEIAINRNDAETAFGALEAASSLGFAGLEAALSAPVFRPLAEDDRMQALLATPPAAIAEAPFAPGLVKNGIGMVTAQNTRWNAKLARLEVVFATPPSQKSKPVSRQKGGVWDRLNKMARRGQAAGNVGDVYDNRDAGHSTPPGLDGVQLTVAKYSEAARAKGLHYGLNEALIFDAIAFGNSSTALKGQGWRSQARHALTTRLGPIRAWQLYDNNHIYVFPEHRDHDAVADKGHGDVFPANTPLMLISKGSSGSDRRFLQAIQIILAGFKPEVKALLKEKRLIAPTVQQILRRGMKGIETEEQYLSAAAHPTVFRPKWVDLDRVLDLANALEVGAVPPRAQIAVADEARAQGPFASPVPEELFTTPDAIARSWRGGERVRRYTLSAAGSWDANDRTLTFFWRVLRGDPSRVRIERLTPDASEVEVTIEWHEGIRAPDGLKSSRVDIALFAHNGSEYSAPAMFSLDLPTHQRRVYSDDPSDNRPLSISYLPNKGDRAYVDPVVWPWRGWNDAFDYSDKKELLGWTRTYRKGGAARFTRHGLKVVELDDLARPAKAEAVRYELARNEKGRSFLKEQAAGRVFLYSYASDADLLGSVAEVAGQ